MKDSRIRYLFVGGTSVLLEYGSFWMLLSIGHLDVVSGNIISFLLAFIYTFILHNRWSFSGSHAHSIKRQLMSYSLLASINVLATSILISFQVGNLGIEPLIAKLICMALVVMWNYLLLSRVIFKSSHKELN